MSFEPVQLLFLMIWGFFLYKALFKRRKRPPADLPPDIPPQEKSVPPSAPDADGEYDYQVLRKKILTTWGKQEEDKELDLPDEMERPVYQENPLPKRTFSATMKKKEETSDTGTSREERRRMERMQAYARQKPKREERPNSDGAHPSEETSDVSVKEWTEKDAREWVRYDAVFGSPRAKAPWQPVGKR